MNPLSVVIGLEVGEFSFKVTTIPKQYVVEKLTSGCANKPFNKWMRNRDVGYRFDFIDPQYSQIGLPAMKLEQRVVIGAEISRSPLPSSGVIEHTAQCGSIDVAAMNSDPDYAARELVHDDQHPVTLNNDGLAPKEVNTP